MSCFNFQLVIYWIFTDDIELLLSKHNDPDKKTQHLTTEGERVGIKLKPQRCKPGYPNFQAAKS